MESYLEAGGVIGSEVLSARIKDLKRKTAVAILKLSNDDEFKQALRAAGETRKMLEIQRAAATERYLAPALEICRAKGFVLPLSLAVVYDSCIHGSFERIAAITGKVKNEKVWMTAYIRRRHAWLASVKRLKPTVYRTRFFMEQIARGNWHLALPINVQGISLTTKMLPAPSLKPTEPPASGPGIETAGMLERARDTVTAAADRFDRVDSIITIVQRRTDAAKSLWTTIAGTAWQAIWAVIGFAAGLPRYIWVITAITVAALTLAYLYRQISLGRIREKSNLSLNRNSPPYEGGEPDSSGLPSITNF